MPSEVDRLGSIISAIKFQRIVTSSRFIPEIDGFRFLAIFIVVMSHVYGQCGPVPTGSSFAQALFVAFQDGKRGVYLFFTISGFILALPFARHHLQQGSTVSLASYFRRRLTRLEPPYIVAMVARFFVLIAYKSKLYTAGVLLLRLLASLFYVHGVIYAQYPVVNPPAWSLEVEVQFYILAPALTTIFAIRSALFRRVLLLTLIALTGIFAAHVVVPLPRLSLTLLGFLQYFLAGFFLVDLYLTDAFPNLSPLFWDVVGLLSLGWIMLNHSSMYLILLPFVTIALYLAGFKGQLLRSCFSWAPVTAVGGMCYSLYLTHTTVLTFMAPYVRRIEKMPMADPFQLLGIFIPCLIAVLLVGAFFYLLVERPCMAPDWPNRLAQKFRRSGIAS